MTTRIRWVSWGGDCGYAVAARRYLRGARAAGLDAVWTPMVPGSSLGPGLFFEPGLPPSDSEPLLFEVHSRGLLPVQDDILVMHMPPEYYPALASRFPARRIVGMTVWETDRLPGHWPPLFAPCHRIIVPCRFNLRTIHDAGVTTPVSVVPHGFDDIPPGLPPPIPAKAGDVVFYTIGVWTHRKNQDGLLRAFLDAFTGRDPALLVLKTSPRDQTRRRRGLWKFLGTTRLAVWLARHRRRNPARVHLITDSLPSATVAGLHARGDCFASLARGEGWGLGAFEAAAAGVPVVMTGWGGQLDFLDAEASGLVHHDLVPVLDPAHSPSYTPDQRWAEPRHDHAVSLLREVAADPAAARRRARPLRDRIRRDFADTAIASSLATALGLS